MLSLINIYPNYNFFRTLQLLILQFKASHLSGYNFYDTLNS